MNEAIQRYLEAASGVTTLTKSKAEQIAKQLVRSGEAASDQVGELVDQLMERQRSNQEAVSALVRSETARAIRAMGLASRSEVERLQKQVADLKREVATMDPPSRGSGPAKKTAKKTAKKSAAKKTAKKAAKRSAKKSAAKKTAKKATAKKAAKKSSGS